MPDADRVATTLEPVFEGHLSGCAEANAKGVTQVAPFVRPASTNRGNRRRLTDGVRLTPILTLSTMEATETNSALRESALRSIGRNVVNFQRLEHLLKFISLLQGFEGSISKVENEHEKRIEKAARHTLGQAIQEWQKVVLGRQSSGGATADLFEPWLSWQFDIGIDKEKAAVQGDALLDLATERNNLIHHDLASVNFESATQCQELIHKLDDQNTRILDQLRILAPLKAAIREILSALQSALISDEFLNQLNSIAEEDDV